MKIYFFRKTALLLLLALAFLASFSRAQEIKQIENDKSIKPPIVDEKKGWRLKRDSEWLGWDKNGKATKVFKCSENKTALIWVDANGIHVFDQAKNSVRTLLDLRWRNYKSGPGVNYAVQTDVGRNYFVVRWSNGKDSTKNEIEEYYTALIDIRTGTTLWKNLQKSSDAVRVYYQNLKPSVKGNMLVQITNDSDEMAGPGVLQVWASNGKVLGELPGTPVEYNWSADGSAIEYKWFSMKSRKERKELFSKFNEKAEWLSGDKN